MAADGLSPNAWVVFISPDTIAIWRLRKSVALHDARWYLDKGRSLEAAHLVRSARSCHHEIMRIRFYLRGRRLRAVAEHRAKAVEVAFQPEPQSQERVANLSPRETQAAKLVALKLSNGEIAERLKVSTQTAAVFVSIAKRKMGAPNRAALGELAASWASP